MNSDPPDPSVALVPAPPPGGAELARGRALLAEEVRATVEAVGHARAPETQRGYASDWRQFGAWLRARGLARDPLEMARDAEGFARLVATYVTALARGSAHADRFTGAPRAYRPRSIARRLAAIAYYVRRADLPDPTTRAVAREAMEAARRELGMRANQKLALSPDEVARMAAACAPDDAGSDGGDRDAREERGVRDAAVCLFGLASACRRSELAAADVGDVRLDAAGARLLLRRSKTDQRGEGRHVMVPRAADPAACPVAALEAWLAVRRGHGAGPADPVFVNVGYRGRGLGGRMRPRQVAAIMKRAAAAIGLDPAAVGGHSARAGYITARAMRGDSPAEIAQQTGHRSLDTLAGYIRARGAEAMDPKRGVF